MAASTLARVSRLTRPSPLTTRDTVFSPTPASSATWLIVGRAMRPPRSLQRAGHGAQHPLRGGLGPGIHRHPPAEAKDLDAVRHLEDDGKIMTDQQHGHTVLADRLDEGAHA